MILIFLPRAGPSMDKGVEDKQGDPYCQRGIRYIKGRPVKAAREEVQKIYNMPMDYPVREIPRSSPEYQGQPGPVFPVPDYQHSHHYDCGQGYYNEESVPEPFEHSEGRPGVLDMDNIEKRQHAYGLKETQLCFDDIFCGLI